MRFKDIFHRKDKKSANNTESYRFLKSTINGYAKKIDAPKSLLPTYGYSENFARPHIKIDRRKMIHFLVKERGKIIEKKSAVDLKHIIYWVFEGVTASMAWNYELTNRIDNQDPRKIAFEKQEKLLGLINPDYAEWSKNEHDIILKKNSYVDNQ